jgi:hypothetical protein
VSAQVEQSAKGTHELVPTINIQQYHLAYIANAYNCFVPLLFTLSCRMFVFGDCILAPVCFQPGLHKGPWTDEEDEVVKSTVIQMGIDKVKWSTIASQVLCHPYSCPCDQGVACILLVFTPVCDLSNFVGVCAAAWSHRQAVSGALVQPSGPVYYQGRLDLG